MTGDARRLKFEEVPPIPPDAEHWVDDKHLRKYIVYDHGDCRWRISEDGATLMCFIRYRPKPEGFVKVFNPWAELYTAPHYGG